MATGVKAKLILAKEDVLTVSRALELALFLGATLDVSEIWRNEMVIAPAWSSHSER
jgi:hypothetical protein